MSGRIGDLSPGQAEVLKNFKENITDILKPEYDDHFFLRWLRARNFDLTKSEAMLRNHIAWQKKVKVDAIKEEFKQTEVMQKYDPGGLFGYDKEGTPIYYYPIGCIDIKGLMRSAKKSDLVKNRIVLLETLDQVMKEETERQGKMIDTIGYIFDFEHFGMKHLWKPGIDLFIEVFTIYESHYPETLKFCFVINAPKIFPIAFNLVKPFLSEETIRKTKICGRHYKSELLKHIHADQLPAHYGGTCCDPDPKCTAKIKYGGEVPKSYYLQMSEELENVVNITVKRGSHVCVDFDVSEPNCILRWQFSTCGHDIKFGVFKKTNDHSHKYLEEIISPVRIDSHLVPEDGLVRCPDIGTYVLKFDNSYSWIRSKKISYFAEVLKPDIETDMPSDLIPSESTSCLEGMAESDRASDIVTHQSDPCIQNTCRSEQIHIEESS